MPTACLWQSWQDGHTSPPPAPPCSAGPPSAISTTPPSLLLGEAAERNYDHPSQPPLS